MHRPASLQQRWNQFWFGREATHSLCLLRIAVGLVLLFNATGGEAWLRLHVNVIRLPLRGEYAAGSTEAFWRAPYPGFSWLPSPTVWMIARLEEAIMLLAVLMILGLGTRLVIPLTTLLLGYLFFVSQWNFTYDTWSLILALGVLSLGRCGEHYSIDAQLRDPTKTSKGSWKLPRRILQLQVVSCYLFMLLWMLDGDWLSGEIMADLDSQGVVFRGWAGNGLEGSIPQLRSVAIAAAAGWLAIGFAIPIFHRLAIFVGIFFHLAMDATIPMGSLPCLMVALYIAFIHPAAGATVVLYDASSPGQQRLVRWGKALDWLRRCTWLPLDDPTTKEVLSELNLQLPNGFCIVSNSGHVLAGETAMVRLFRWFPLTFIPASVAGLPGVAWVVARLLRCMAVIGLPLLAVRWFMVWMVRLLTGRPSQSQAPAETATEPAWRQTLGESQRP